MDTDQGHKDRAGGRDERDKGRGKRVWGGEDTGRRDLTRETEKESDRHNEWGT